MADEWENAHGLKPSDPADASADRDKGGYTNIEQHLNSLCDAVRYRRQARP